MHASLMCHLRFSGRVPPELPWQRRVHVRSVSLLPRVPRHGLFKRYRLLSHCRNVYAKKLCFTLQHLSKYFRSYTKKLCGVITFCSLNQNTFHISNCKEIYLPFVILLTKSKTIIIQHRNKKLYLAYFRKKKTLL